MGDKRKLMAAIMGAITAYIQMELQPPSMTPSSRLDQKLITEDSPATGVNEKEKPKL